MDNIEELKEEYRKAQAEVNHLRNELVYQQKELDKARDELKRKADLAEMYKHMLDERTEELEEMTENNTVNEAAVNDLNITVDILASRIGALKDDLRR